MPITVTTKPETPADNGFASEPEIVASPSPLDGLKAKLAAATDNLYVDLEVPRWPEQMGLRVFVRYSALSPSYAVKQIERFQKSKDDDWAVQANAQMLVNCCQGIYAIDPKDTDRKLSFRPEDPDGEWTRFDESLSQTLGAPLGTQGGSAIAVCRKLYFTEGDLTAAATMLADWSAKAADQVDFTTP